MIHSTPSSPSHSRLSCLHHCSRKYWHRYVCEQPHDEVVNAAMHAGKVMHAGLDAYYRGADYEAAIDVAWGTQMFHGDDAWLTRNFIQMRMQKYIDADAGGWKPKLLSYDDIQWENVIEHEAEWDDDGNLILAEARFMVSIGEGISIVNVPDLVLDYAGYPVVVDHKCRFGWINEKQRTEMEVGHQLRMGALTYEALTGERCRDGWMNSIYIGKNSCKSSSKAKMRELSQFGPWSHEQMQATWEWIEQGIVEMDLDANEPKEYRAMNPGQHCHWCDFREECIGE